VQNSFVREVFARDTQADMGHQYTRSRYHHLYINGVYWGLFQTQERVEEHFAESYFGGDESDYDVIKAGGLDNRVLETTAGNDAAWRQLFDYGEALAASPVANANLYWTMQGLNPDGTRNASLPVLLDVDNLIDYMLIVFYTGAYDMPLSSNSVGNNWFTIYDRVRADQGFQFFAHDNEHSLGPLWGGPVHGSQNIDRTGPFNNGNQSNYQQSNPQYLHQDLLAHPEYKQRFIDRAQKHFFNGGALTVAASTGRLMERVAEVDPAVIAEAARWGDAQVATPHNKTTWQTEINWLVNAYYPGRGILVLNQLLPHGLFTTFAAPTFSKYGGEVPNNYPLTMTAGAGTIYYTTDGVTDPRAIGGAVNTSPAVKVYSGAVSISGTTTVKARLRTVGGQWSGLVEATFSTVTLAGDYNGSGTVDLNDYSVWRAMFGATVQPGVGADGNNNGVVDAADYVVWRDNLGASLPVAAEAVTEGEVATIIDTALAVVTGVTEPVVASTATGKKVDAPRKGTMTFSQVGPAAGSVGLQDQLTPARRVATRTAVVDSNGNHLLVLLDKGVVGKAAAAPGRMVVEAAWAEFDGIGQRDSWLDLLENDELALLVSAEKLCAF
jgi:hypothetical protein